MQKEYSVLLDKMHQRLREKDEEMKAMDQSDIIKDLESKLKKTKEEKLQYQNLAQDKTNVIEQLVNSHPGTLNLFNLSFIEHNLAVRVYEDVERLMEEAEEDK